MAQTRGLLAVWEPWRMLGVALALLSGIFMFVAVHIPLGFVAFITLVATAHMCKPIGEPGSNGQHYFPDSGGFKKARFLMGYKSRFRDAVSPLVVFGFGPSVVDDDHGYQPGWTPIGRLSSFWAYLAALSLASIDVALKVAHLPILPSWFWLVSAPLSVVGWLFTIQSYMFIKLLQADKTGIIGIEPAPATMVSALKQHYDMGKILRKSLIIGLSISVVPAVVGLVAHWSWWVILLTIALITFVVMLAQVSHLMKVEYRSQWQHRVDRREFWSGTLAYLKDTTPILVQEYELPTLQDWEASGGPETGLPYSPTVHMAVFRFAPNATFFDYASKKVDIEGRVKGALSAAHVIISPIADHDPDTDEEILGSVGSKGFRLWWTDRHVDINTVFDPETDEYLRDFAAQATIITVLNQLQRLGHNNAISCGLITRKQSALQILEMTVAPFDANINVSDFQKSLADVQRNIGVGWVRAYSPMSSIQAGAPNNVVKLLIAFDDPISFEAAGQMQMEEAGNTRKRNPNQVRFSMPASAIRKIIQRANWEYYFRINGVQSAATFEVPKMLSNKAKTAVTNEMQFSQPDGLEYSRVAASIEGIKQASGNSFMEITQGIGDGSDDSKSQEERDRKAAESKSSFTVVASKKDPLARLFAFGDYEDQILSPRNPGNERVTWHPGIMANDELATDSFDSDEPHLLIAGTSGSGKSVVLQNMILQLAHNNSPQDVRFRMIEPKIGMQRFRHLDSVEQFVDPWSYNGKRVKDAFFESCAELLEDTVREMERRNEILQRRSMTPGQFVPEKLVQGRTIARREGPNADGTPHELMLPYTHLIIEECATVYTGAQDKDVANTIAYCAGRIAREGRSAGIYMTNLTQYPTNASIPSTIRQQMRRLGLATSNQLASQIIIDQPGLEKLRIKGTGLIKSGYGYRQYRGFFLRDGDTGIGEPNDIVDISGRIPLSEMARSLGVSTGSAEEIQRLMVPEPGPTIFDLWKNSAQAHAIAKAVDEGLSTKDLKGFSED